MSSKFVNGAWLPFDEADPVMLSNGRSYQGGKLMEALPFCRKARVAIDVGAHCGLWTMQLGNYFETVEAFEPLERHIECWRKNAGWKLSCKLHEVALGEKPGKCGIHLVETLSGRSYVEGSGNYEMKKLDDYGFENVDFIKIDVEGYELPVIKGAVETIKRCKPVMVVEQKPRHGQRYGLSDKAAVEYLESLGAKVRKEIVGDYILSWENVED